MLHQARRLLAVDVALVAPGRTAVVADSTRSRILLFLAVVLCGGLITACQRPVASHNMWLSVLNAAVAIAFLVAGSLLVDEPERRRSALGFIAAGLLYPVARSGGTDSVAAMPLPMVAGPADSLFWCAVAWGLLHYPYGRLSNRYEGFYLVYMALSFLGSDVVLLRTSPVQAAAPDWTYWGVYHFIGQPIVVRTVLGLNAALVGLGFIALVALRWRRSHGIDRRMLTPIVVSAALAGVVAGMGALYYYTYPTADLGDEAYLIIGWAALGIPASFLVVSLRRRWIRQAATDAMLNVARPPTIGAVRDGLRRALRDDTVEIWYWVPEEARYVDTAGRRADGGWPRDRLVVHVSTTEGAPLAVVVADPSLAAHRDVVDVAVAASALWLEIGRLQAVARTQLGQVRESRARLVSAELAERRRLERDLHDGAQQYLLAAKAALAVARAKTTDAAAAEAIEQAQQDLDLATRSVRDLANGILPPLLAHGLRPALEALAERAPLAVQVDVRIGRIKQDLEATAFFVVSECLANAGKHAAATRVSVRAEQCDGTVSVRVTDDGVGGADPHAHGLAGLADRVRALGGELRVTSPPGAGTQVEAVLPCA